MLLTIDIGNTTVAIGGFHGSSLRFLCRMPSDRTLTPSQCAEKLRRLLGGKSVSLQQIEGCVLASVVPSLTSVVCRAVQMLTDKTPLVVDRTNQNFLKIKGYDTSNLGTDRIVDCVAALNRWQPPLAVFDLGTATTLSVLDKDGAFCGGMILPGLRLSVDALTARAAQLPAITFEQPKGVIGTDTVSCMQYGALYGTAGAIEGIVQRLANELGEMPTVVLTGGHARHIVPLLRCKVEYEPQLQLMGLREIYWQHRGRNKSKPPRRHHKTASKRPGGAHHSK